MKRNRKPPGPAPRPDARRVTLSLKVNADELALIERAAKHDGKPKTVWARETLIRAAKRRKA